MLLSYLQVICSTIIAATFQTAECKSDSYPSDGLSGKQKLQIVFQQCLSSQMTMRAAYHRSGRTGVFPTRHRLQCFTLRCVVGPGGCVCPSAGCHKLTRNHCVLPDFYPLLMEIPIHALKPSNLWKHYWRCGFGLFRLTTTSCQVISGRYRVLPNVHLSRNVVKSRQVF